MRLNFGCGPVQPEGWTNVDKDRHGQRWVCAIEAGLPFHSDSFDYAVANHSLNMVAYRDLVPALSELRRVLKRGGVLRVLAPDVAKAVRAWLDGDLDFFPVPQEVSTDGKFCVFVPWHGFQRSVFTTGWLIDLCYRAGFSYANGAPFGETSSRFPEIVELDSRESESLIVEAFK